MKTKLIFAVVAILFLSYCKKDNKDQQQNNSKTQIEITNFAGETYLIYIDEVYKAPMNAGDIRSWEVAPGSHYIEAKEKEYIFSQTVYSQTVYCGSGLRTDWYFGD